MPAHVDFTSSILVLVLCLLLNIDNFLLLDLSDVSCIRNYTVNMDH